MVKKEKTKGERDAAIEVPHDNDRRPCTGGAFSEETGEGTGSKFRTGGKRPSVQLQIWASAHRSSDDSEISAGGVSVRHPIRAAD